MSIDSLLIPIQWVDEEIERQYAKAVKKIDEKGLNVYMICIPLNLLFVRAPPILSPIIEGLYSGFDACNNLQGLSHNQYNKVTDSAIAKRKDETLYEYITNAFRLPVFLAGAGFATLGTYQLIDSYLFSGDSNSNDAIKNLYTGIAWLSQASSVYLKNADPKLLDKEPAWKSLLNWATEKIRDLTPQPQPNLTPG